MSVRTPILPGRYEAPQLIGRGGMGEIYVARDRELGRTVAVKLLVERFSEEPELRERFRREALTAARLSGEPHVVTIYDVGEHEGRPLTVMEYLPGGTVAERARPAGAPEDRRFMAAGGGRSPRYGARARCRPPRREAGQHALRRFRPAAGGRLRDRAPRRRDDGA